MHHNDKFYLIMKTIRNILIALLIILILLIIVGLFLPADRHIETKAIIKAPEYIVFDHVNDLKKWEEWLSWATRDTQIMLEYENPSYGTGAVCKWNSPNRQTGRGSMKILESRPYELILIEISFMEKGKIMCPWTFRGNAGETTVIWGLDMKNMNVAERYFSLFVYDLMEPYFKQGLDSLKSLSEMISGKLSLIEEVELKPIPAITITDSSVINNFNLALTDIFAELSAYCKKRKIKPAAPPYCIYHNRNREGYSTFEAGIPLSVAVPAKGRIKSSRTPSGKALKIEYIGPYFSIGIPYELLGQYIKARNYTIVGSPWEVYFKGRWSEPDSNKWVTYIYFPVK